MAEKKEKSAPETPKEKAVSAQKVIYTEIDDEVTSIFDRLKNTKAKNIYIVVPKRAVLLQSIVNLKILKRKAEDISKNVHLITNDSNGIKLAQQVGLKVFDKVSGPEHPSLVAGMPQDDKLMITPLTASVTAAKEESPSRLKEKKLSLSEILRRGREKKVPILLKLFL